jgi:DNA repair protein RadD
MKLRPYQQKCSDIAIEYFEKTSEKPSILVLPTAWGKSVLIADAARRLGEGVLVLQPSKELLEQNYSKFITMGGKASIYSASAGQKEFGSVTYATIGSIKNLGAEFKRRGYKYIIVDECHLFPPKDSMFSGFVSAMGCTKVLGVTATPFRLQTSNDINGWPISKLVMLTSRAKNAGFFKEILHVHQIQDIVKDGYWSKLAYEEWDFDSGTLKYNSAGSDFTESSMAEAYDNLDIRSSIIRRIRELDRKSILVFVPLVAQATELARSIPNAVAVYGDMVKPERDEAVQGFKSGKYRVVINVNVLSVGFDHPGLDCVIFGRPTASLSWFYQAAGRGTRIHPDKEDCLIVDFVGNIARFGRLENLTVEQYKASWQVFNGDIQLTTIPIRDIGTVRKEKPFDPNAPVEDFVWPFGKHKGTLITKIDKGYLNWALKNFDWSARNIDLKQRIEKELASRSLSTITV